MSNKKILMVLTSYGRIEAADRPTGLWLEEFVIPYLKFQSEGYEVTIASPQGGQVPVDPQSLPQEEQPQEWAQVRQLLDNTLSLEAVGVGDYEAIFISGGHGTMFDLPGNSTLQQLLRDFMAHDKVVAAVCHAPAAFVGATLADGTPLVAGKTLTSFTNSEEQAAQMDKFMPFLLETALKEAGANFVNRPDWSDHVEQDGKLITGQNPQSSGSVAQAVIKAVETAPQAV